MQILVKTLTGRTLTLDVKCGTRYFEVWDTIDTVRAYVHKQDPTPANEQRLFYDVNELLDGHTLAHYHIWHNNATIYMLPALAEEDKKEDEEEDWEARELRMLKAADAEGRHEQMIQAAKAATAASHTLLKRVWDPHWGTQSRQMCVHRRRQQLRDFASNAVLQS